MSISEKIQKYKERYNKYQAKKDFQMQVMAEQKARTLEKKAQYANKLNERLERQLKAQKKINKLETTKSRLSKASNPKPIKTISQNPASSNIGFDIGGAFASSGNSTGINIAEVWGSPNKSKKKGKKKQSNNFFGGL